jgi:hypothetical protein
MTYIDIVWYLYGFLSITFSKRESGMKMRAVVTLATVLLGGLASLAVSQINMESNGTVTIRNSSLATRYTYNYGDLELSGGNQGTSRGWLWANKATIRGPARVDGDLSVYGEKTLFNGSVWIMGSKNFLQPHPTDATKFIRYSAMESGEALTIARGTAKTVNGEAKIALPEHFSLVTCKNEPITVILTPEGAPVLLYTKQKSTNEIVVAMKSDDLRVFRDVEFSYQVTGVRDGFERQEIIVSEDKLNEKVAAREDVQRRIDTYVGKLKAEQELEAANRRRSAEAE